MKILILGGNGFIGRNVINARPEWKWTINTFDLLDWSKVDQIEGEYDVLLNCAGYYGGIVFNKTYQQEILHKNLHITANIFKLIDKIKPKKIVQIGGACMYPADSKGLLSESMLCSGPYDNSIKFTALSKEFQLRILKTLDIDWEFLVLANVYGPGESLDFKKSHFVGSLINKIKTASGYISMIGTGLAVRDFIYITDAAEAICRFCELPYANCVPINIGSGKATSIRTVTEYLVSIINKPIDIRWGDAIDNGALHKVLNIEKMVNCIEFQPTVNIFDGINQTWKSHEQCP